MYGGDCRCVPGFALGWGPIPWLIMSEVFPVKVRGFAGAVCVLTNWSMAFVVTKTFQDMMVSPRQSPLGLLKTEEVAFASHSSSIFAHLNLWVLS